MLNSRPRGVAFTFGVKPPPQNFFTETNEGKPPQPIHPGHKCGRIEIYGRVRFFTVTGKHFPGTPRCVSPYDPTALYARLNTADPLQKKPPQSAQSAQTAPHSEPVATTGGRGIIAQAWGDDTKFDALMEGNFTQYTIDMSAAVHSLVCMLVIRYGSDPAIIDTKFRASGMFKDQWVIKWERLWEKEIARAIDYVSKQATAGAGVASPKADVCDVWSLTDLITEKDIVTRQGTEVKYVVQDLIPSERITMLFGPEKSCKSLFAFYLQKCVANGIKVLDSYTTVKTPCIYFDREDGVLGSYVDWMSDLGSELVNFFTLRDRNPELDDKNLIKICQEHKPLIVLDSLHKFLDEGKNSWRSDDMEPVLGKMRALCVYGATIVLIHHSTKSDKEQYRDSSAIGAGVDFLYAVVGTQPGQDGVKHVEVIGPAIERRAAAHAAPNGVP